MKRVAFTLTIVLGITLQTLAQTSQSGWKYATYVEKTKMSIHLGNSVVYDFRYKYHGYDRIFSAKLGVFFQRSTQAIGSERPIRHMETSLAGLSGEFEILNSHYFSLDANVRMALQNKENFLITPSLFASIHPYKNITVSGGIGMRGFTTTGMMRVIIKLNSKHQKRATSHKF